MNNNQVITRVAPSPTGNLNLGTARMMLFNYLYAKQNNGKIILRFEDTDKARSRKEFEDNIKESVDWLGLKFDEIYRQSERTEIYKKYLEKMIADGTAYISKETEGKRSEVIRFKNPNTKIAFNDTNRGDITIDTTDLEDFIIARSIDDPLYHLTVVVDDFEMGVTHIIRGEDGIANTPRQILIQEAIGAPRPLYTHMPMVLGNDKKKLSKRHGAKSVLEWKEEGYFKEAIINQLAFLGWNPGTDQEIFSMDELIKAFDLSKIQLGGAVFNMDKLNWYNKHYLSTRNEGEVANAIMDKLDGINEDIAERLIPTIKERISVYSDIDIMKESGELDYYSNDPDYNVNSIVWKDSGLGEAKEHLNKARELLSNADFSSAENIKNSIWDYASEKGKGNVLWPLRYALSGKDKSPDPFELSYIFGKEITIKRIDNAISKIEKE
ncbi:glutamate--tRNA ligase [Candidatus Nomurabacteria bacterium]|nr:glutamate--tRNA ligase [Candidatus Nomurabacteria bacterium]